MKICMQDATGERIELNRNWMLKKLAQSGWQKETFVNKVQR